MRSNSIARMSLLVVALAALGLVAGCSNNENPLTSSDAMSFERYAVSDGPGFGNEDNKNFSAGDILKVDEENEVILLDVEASSSEDDNSVVFVTKNTRVQFQDGSRGTLNLSDLAVNMFVTAYGTIQADGRFLAHLIVMLQNDRSGDVSDALFSGTPRQSVRITRSLPIVRLVQERKHPPCRLAAASPARGISFAQGCEIGNTPSGGSACY